MSSESQAMALSVVGLGCELGVGREFVIHDHSHARAKLEHSGRHDRVTRFQASGDRYKIAPGAAETNELLAQDVFCFPSLCVFLLIDYKD